MRAKPASGSRWDKRSTRASRWCGRCWTVATKSLREAQDASLLDVLFGQTPGDPNDAARTQPAIYALECALTALWASVGIRPSVVVGHGLGELAAAQAAGVFGLEDGLRFAAARGALLGGLPEVGAQTAALDDLQAALEGIAIAPPSLTLVSHVTGRAVEPGETLDAAYWRRQASEPGAPDRSAETLADLEVDTVVEIGPRTTPESTGDGWTPVVLSSLREPSDDRAANSEDGAFAEAVAEAYAAGLPVSFAGLFAGETRRRISLPGYPFQRRPLLDPNVEAVVRATIDVLPPLCMRSHFRRGMLVGWSGLVPPL